jgi:hypothetical protein
MGTLTRLHLVHAKKESSSHAAIYSYGSVILIAVTGHWISHARQRIQSFSLAGSVLLAARIACPLAFGVSHFGVSNHSKTLTGHTDADVKVHCNNFAMDPGLFWRLDCASHFVTHMVLSY